MSNLFSVNFGLCSQIQSRDLNTYWILNRFSTFEESIDKYCMIERSNNQLVLNANELEFGNYTINAYAYLPGKPENYVLLGNYVLVVGASPLIVSLNGGELSIELERNKNLTLDFVSATYDPDASSRENKNMMNFYLFCFQSKEDSDLSIINQKITNFDDDFTSMQNLNQVLDLSIENTESSNVASASASASGVYRIIFYERDCVSNADNLNFNLERGSIFEINSTSLKLNETNSLSIQLFVKKLNRFSKSQKLYLNLDLTSFLTVDLNTDLKEMSKQLDKLDELAKQNPKRALSLINNFADAINTKADNVDDQVYFF
jgi:hypothetical protein